MLPRWKPALYTVVLMTLLTACSQEAVKTQPQPNQTQPATPQGPEQPPAPTYAYTAPFTGMGTNEKERYRHR